MKYAAMIALLVLAACGDPAKQPQDLPTMPLAIQKQDGSAVTLIVQLADDLAETTKGLMFVTDMPEDHGMLFRFPETTVQSFWMRNTLIPLDMLFIGKGGRIVHIAQNVQPLDESGVSSRFPVAEVLEVNGGYTAKHNIQPGDVVVVAKAPQTH